MSRAYTPSGDPPCPIPTYYPEPLHLTEHHQGTSLRIAPSFPFINPLSTRSHTTRFFSPSLFLSLFLFPFLSFTLSRNNPPSELTLTRWMRPGDVSIARTTGA